MIKVFEAFAGYGSQSLAFKKYGIDFECVGISEIDKYSLQAYKSLHGYVKNYGDIEKINSLSLPDMDLLTYSFPCQDISTAGIQRGLEEGSGSRSSLLWECQKIIEMKRPKYLMMENVKNLVGKKHKHYFDKWLDVLDSLGYNNYWKVINAKYCGIPQNRERVFCVSVLKDYDDGTFKFHDDFDSGIRLKDVLEDRVDEKYYLSDKMVKGYIEKSPSTGYINQDTQASKVISDTEQFQTLCAGTHGYANGYIKQNRTQYIKRKELVVDPNKLDMVGMLDIKGNESIRRVYGPKGLSPSLTTMQGGNRQPKIVETNKINKAFDIPREILNDNERQRRVYDVKGIAPGILARNDSPKIIKACAIRGRNSNNPKSRVSGVPTVQMLEVGKTPDISNCLTTVQKDSMILESKLLGCHNSLTKKHNWDHILDKNFRIRKLTPKECFRLMGVNDSDIDKIQATGLSNTQQYKMAGNSIVVDCLRFLKRLK